MAQGIEAGGEIGDGGFVMLQNIGHDLKVAFVDLEIFNRLLIRETMRRHYTGQICEKLLLLGCRAATGDYGFCLAE